MKLKGNKCLGSEINFQGIFPHMALTFMARYMGWFCSSSVLNNPECMAEYFSTWQCPTYSFGFMREAPTHLSNTESMENKSKFNTKNALKEVPKDIWQPESDNRYFSTSGCLLTSLVTAVRYVTVIYPSVKLLLIEVSWSTISIELKAFHSKLNDFILIRKLSWTLLS